MTDNKVITIYLKQKHYGYSGAEAARILGINYYYLKKYVKIMHLDIPKVGNRYCFTDYDIQAIRDKRKRDLIFTIIFSILFIIFGILGICYTIKTYH